MDIDIDLSIRKDITMFEMCDMSNVNSNYVKYITNFYDLSCIEREISHVRSISCYCKILFESDWFKVNGSKLTVKSLGYEKDIFFNHLDYRFIYAEVKKADGSLFYIRFIKLRIDGLAEANTDYDEDGNFRNKLLKCIEEVQQDNLENTRKTFYGFDEYDKEEILDKLVFNLDMVSRKYSSITPFMDLYFNCTSRNIFAYRELSDNHNVITSKVFKEDKLFESVQDLIKDVSNPSDVNWYYQFGDIIFYR